MKKVIFIASTLNTGGAQKILSNLVMNLPDGYEAYIVLNDTENIVYPYKGELISLNFRQQDNKLNILYQLKVFFKRVRLLRKMKATGEYAASVSFLDSANIANIISGRKKCRTILSVHNNLTESGASPVYKYMVNPMVRLLYGRADKVIAVSKGIAYDLIHNLKLSDENIVTIYNGHDIEGIRKQTKEAVSPEAELFFEGYPVVATMGRMDYQKGQWHLIRALAGVKKEFPEMRLLLLGDGELCPYLKHLAHECGLEENVVFCGFQENPFSLLVKCDVFVLPSMFEGFPNALIEALGCGLPCIATDFRSGAREILAPELPVEGQIKSEVREASYGLLSPVCDGKQYDGKTPLTKEEVLLAEAILRLLQDEKLQQKYRIKCDKAVESLDIMHMIREWLEIIEG